MPPPLISSIFDAAFDYFRHAATDAAAAAMLRASATLIDILMPLMLAAMPWFDDAIAAGFFAATCWRELPRY